MEIEFRRKPEVITQYARKMRISMTYAEKCLWSQLKGKQLQGWKFHRQKPLFVYTEESGKDGRVIADFYHHPSKVVIEVDGSIHDLEEVQARDMRRTELLEQRGFLVVRYTNDEVIHNLDAVIEQLQTIIFNRLEAKQTTRHLEPLETNDTGSPLD